MRKAYAIDLTATLQTFVFMSSFRKLICTFVHSINDFGLTVFVLPFSSSSTDNDDEPGLPVRSDTEVRRTMYVQGVSHWAPANIGPYSQCVQVRYFNICFKLNLHSQMLQFDYELLRAIIKLGLQLNKRRVYWSKMQLHDANLCAVLRPKTREKLNTRSYQIPDFLL